jgi:hypothetical protein
MHQALPVYLLILQGLLVLRVLYQIDLMLVHVSKFVMLLGSFTLRVEVSVENGLPRLETLHPIHFLTVLLEVLVH